VVETASPQVQLPAVRLIANMIQNNAFSFKSFKKSGGVRFDFSDFDFYWGFLSYRLGSNSGQMGEGTEWCCSSDFDPVDARCLGGRLSAGGIDSGRRSAETDFGKHFGVKRTAGND
jgi:hypothetical protein